MAENVLPLDEVQKILDELAVSYPDAYEEICKICDLLGLKRPPDPHI